MTRVTGFNSPLLVGFDHFERLLDRVQKSQPEGYPPYNIEQIGETRLRITLAVAGFTEDDLAVSVEDNQLVIRGRQATDDGSRAFLHRGIAARQFQRAFVLAEGMEILGASLETGLLHVDLDRPMPEPKVRRVPIRAESARAGAETGRTPRTIDVAEDATDEPAHARSPACRTTAPSRSRLTLKETGHDSE
ncbi:Hsp20 family protein [Roseospira marina]|uniref:Hsp20 family protein n=1 Tax=Roseospira marina TaxID=140057 RepID=A0A5M6I924_9PROT|nr:Hsp20 family protein [Roseospira marina]KAA5604756.1 Hsp20 family protein [Roseospira marina]MBB4313435.1 HSP20 family molecular chaperone IbpA [Roseospira marina]MBB5086597.1 HSP20 family molecular chaperone IbpA [Roseospira marina]